VGRLPTGTVTFLFTDLERSTRLWEEQPEAMRAALARHDQLLREAVASHDGQVIKGTGDGVHAVFVTAESAAGAAVAAQLALDDETWGPTGELRVRMGIHTGGAEQRGDDYYGPVLNRAARLMSVAHGGQVLCSQATADLLRDSRPAPLGLVDLGEHRLRDLDRPEVVFQVTHPELPADFPPLPSATGGAGNLPRQLTSFVGHEDDMTAIARALDETPVVTLTGVGGVGKTRLAIEIASRVATGYRDGVWLCELAGVRNADTIPDAVLDVFGADRGQTGTADEVLRRFLRSKQLLLVLDNCEHLLKPVARLVGDLARESPGVRVLATSREGLGMPGERIVAVRSLSTPEGNEELDAVASCDAVRLFVDRATAARAGFALDASNAAAVAQICERLDGVPLAIELAAARVGMLTPPQLAQRLDERFRILTGSERGAVERHQTLRAAIDWSYELLHDDERAVLDRLSVFAGGFTLDAAEVVAAGGEIDADAVFDVLSRLVARSLVEADTEGAEARYRLLETIRQYAEERLDAAGDTTRVRHAHARYFAAFGESALAGSATPAELDWLLALSRETDNIRVALAWAIDSHDVDTTLRLLALDGFEIMVFSPELSSVLRSAAGSALALPGIAEDPRYPLVLLGAAMHCRAQGDWTGLVRYCDDAAAAETRLGLDPGWLVWMVRTWVALTEGDVDKWVECTERALAICRTRDDPIALTLTLTGAAMAHGMRGDDETVWAAEIDEALILAEELGIPSLLGRTRTMAAFVLVDVQPERARRLMAESMRDLEAQQVRGAPVHSVLGDVAERLGDPRHALEYFVIGMDELHWLGQSEIVGRMLRRVGLGLIDHDPEAAAVAIGSGMALSHGWTLAPRVTDAHARGVAELNAVLGEPRCAELLAEGAAMPEHDAVIAARAAAMRVLAETP
jgi:predicted ATPase/class 3 adenylate cyclase